MVTSSKHPPCIDCGATAWSYSWNSQTPRCNACRESYNVQTYGSRLTPKGRQRKQAKYERSVEQVAEQHREAERRRRRVAFERTLDEPEHVSPFLGWREYWLRPQFDKGTGELVAYLEGTTGMPLQSTLTPEAVCMHVQHDEYPDPNCKCGYYVTVGHQDLPSWLSKGPPVGKDGALYVVALVQPVGNTYEHERGWRTRQVKLIGVAPGWPDRQSWWPAALAHCVKTFDDVLVYPSVDDLDHWGRDAWTRCMREIGGIQE